MTRIAITESTQSIWNSFQEPEQSMKLGKSKSPMYILNENIILTYVNQINILIFTWASYKYRLTNRYI